MIDESTENILARLLGELIELIWSSCLYTYQRYTCKITKIVLSISTKMLFKLAYHQLTDKYQVINIIV